MSTSSITPGIDYARVPPWHRRRSFRRVCWIAALAAIFGLSPFWWPRARQRATLLISQRRCTNYRAPADLVVLETDPNRITTLSRARSYRKVVSGDLVYMAPEFSAFFAEIWSPNLIATSTVFLHARSNPAGRERLIAVFAAPCHDVLDDSNASLFLLVDVVVPATPLRMATESKSQLGVNYRRIFAVERVFAGQPDPNDPSHFTFVVVTHEKVLHFDGWLRDDDTVKLEPREGYPVPSTFPATTLPAP